VLKIFVFEVSNPPFTQNDFPAKMALAQSRRTKMTKTPLLTAALLAVAIAVIPVRAQDAKKDVAIKPADSPSKVVLDSWNDIGRKLIAMAEDFPEDKYDLKPTPAQRSFAEQLLHAANANYFFTDPAMGKPMPKEEDPKRSDFKTKADIVAFVKKAFADGAAAIKAKGDTGMSDLLVDPFAHQQMRVSDMAYGFIEHSGEHYGQLVVYYRVAGLVPPESRPKK
jgi:uncharacterized damage-inducible protein DinB